MMKIHYCPTLGMYGVCGVSNANVEQFTAYVEDVTCLNCIRTKVGQAKRDMVEAQREMNLWSKRQLELTQ